MFASMPTNAVAAGFTFSLCLYLFFAFRVFSHRSGQPRLSPSLGFDFIRASGYPAYTRASVAPVATVR